MDFEVCFSSEWFHLLPWSHKLCWLLSRPRHFTPQIKPSIFNSESTARSNCFVVLQRDCPTSAERMWPVVGVLTQNKTQCRCFIDKGGLCRAPCTHKIAFSQPDLLSFLSAWGSEDLEPASRKVWSQGCGGNLGCLNMSVGLGHGCESWSLPYKG